MRAGQTHPNDQRWKTKQNPCLKHDPQSLFHQDALEFLNRSPALGAACRHPTTIAGVAATQGARTGDAKGQVRTRQGGTNGSTL